MTRRRSRGHTERLAPDRYTGRGELGATTEGPVTGQRGHGSEGEPQRSDSGPSGRSGGKPKYRTSREGRSRTAGATGVMGRGKRLPFRSKSRFPASAGFQTRRGNPGYSDGDSWAAGGDRAGTMARVGRFPAVRTSDPSETWEPVKRATRRVRRPRVHHDRDWLTVEASRNPDLRGSMGVTGSTAGRSAGARGPSKSPGGRTWYPFAALARRPGAVQGAYVPERPASSTTRPSMASRSAAFVAPASRSRDLSSAYAVNS